MTNTVDWSHYRSFLAVAEAGNLSRAARQLGASQPTLGRHIESLERDLGLALFDRTRRGFHLTRAGEDVLAYARTMQKAAADIAHRTAGLAREVEGTVRISASETVATFILPPILAVLAGKHPALEIELVATNDITSLAEGAADIAVRMMRPTQTGLIAQKLGEMATGLYAARSYLRDHRLPDSLADRSGNRLVGYDRSDLITRGAKRAGVSLTRTDFQFRCDHQVAVYFAIRAGVGIGIAPLIIAENDSELVRVLPNLPMAPLPVWLVCDRKLRSSKRLRVVYDHLATALSARLAAQATA